MPQHDGTDEGASDEIQTGPHKNLLLCRRFMDSAGLFRNCNSLPLFVYPSSSNSNSFGISADGVGVNREAAEAVAVNEQNDIDDVVRCSANKSKKCTNDDINCIIINAMEYLPLTGNNNAGGGTGPIGSTHAHTLILPPTTNGTATNASGNHAVYQHHLNLNHHLNQNHHHLNHHHHHHLLMSHQSATTPYSNNYPLQHSSSHHNIHSDQTKSLQELQHEVGALLEFRDLVIETFPDLKNKMASMSSSSASASSSAAIGGLGLGGANGSSVGGGGGGGASVSGQSVSGTNTLTGGMSSSSLASRREWEPGIRTKRKTSQKESSTGVSSAAGSSSNNAVATANTAAGAGDLSSSSLTRSRSNSHSGKKEPKSGGENNGSVVQDSGFSTETSSSKEGHSASSTNGAMTGPNATNRHLESDDELLNLLDVIHRKSSRLREEVEQLQNYERTQLHSGGELEEPDHQNSSNASTVATAITKTAASGNGISGLTPKTFREHVERLNKEDIKQLRKERDRLLDKLAEMEAETLTGRIRAAKMSDKLEELISVKKDLEEQLKLAMAQKLELSSRVQQLQQQQQSKSSSSQSDFSSQRNFSSTATTVLSTVDSGALLQQQQRRQNTFQPVLVVPSHCDEISSNSQNAFLQSATGSDINSRQEQQLATQPLGRLDGIVSSPGSRNTKTHLPDSKRFAAILLETNVIELQRHLLTLTVQNQVLMRKLEQSTKSKSNIAKRLDKSKEDIDDLRFQLEEKSIELEGTKAQLRVLESRIHTSAPHGNSTPSSYALNSSQIDYETNRSSASTTLMLSRRGLGNESTHSGDMRSSTPSSATTMPPPTSTQISTPSMKAMTHLPMDELQQHSSSTESAHDHELPSSSGGEERNCNSRLLMSTSVGGITVGSLEKRDLATRRYLASTKPSKIPLPGSKSGNFFGGKPPTGRPSSANNSNSSSNSGRSPNSSTANMSSASSSRSSLSRSTGNLLYSKSPNSLKRADSAQSIRNTLNTSNNSNIASGNNATVPSTSRVLQNSPLPKPKRDSITSRLRNIESVSRHTTPLQQQQHNDTPSNMSTSTTGGGNKATTTSNYSFMSSTPKSGSSIASQLNSTLRKDLQLNSNNISPGSQQFLRRTTGGPNATQTSTASNASVTRRFSSASTIGLRSARNQEPHNLAANGHEHGNGNGINSGGNSDSDSGKQMKFPKNRIIFNATNLSRAQIAPQHYSHRRACFKKAKQQQEIAAPTPTYKIKSYFTMCADINCDIMHNIRAGETAISNENISDSSSTQTYIVSKETHGSCFDCDTSMEESSNNLLVTFDYGSGDSLDSYDEAAVKTIFDDPFNVQQHKNGLNYQRQDTIESIIINENLNEKSVSEMSEDLWYFTTPKPRTQESFENISQAFQVHHVNYNNLLTVGESVPSLDSVLPEFDVGEENDSHDNDENESKYRSEREKFMRNYKNFEEIRENDEIDDEEEFYDSIECAQLRTY